MTNPAETTAPRKQRSYIPYLFVLFFVVIAAIDAVLVTIAERTRPGIVTDHAYEKGIAYNDTLALAQARDALGWNADMAYRGGVFTASLMDSKGQPIDGADVRAEFMRPVHDAGVDFGQALAAKSGGHYAAAVKFPLEGLWRVRLYAVRGDDKYQIGRDITVP